MEKKMARYVAALLTLALFMSAFSVPVTASATDAGSFFSGLGGRIERAYINFTGLPFHLSCGEKVSVLYVGNSFVNTGNVPRQVSVLARKYGVACTFRSLSLGGVSLADIREDAIEAMDEKQYTYVVIQDYGTRPGGAGFFEDVAVLCEKAHATGAVPVLYNPAWVNMWASTNVVPDAQMQKIYTDAYREAATANNALLANAGDAWVYAYDTMEGIDLYKPNDYHANDMGAYFTACVFVGTLFGIHVKDTVALNRYHGDLAIPLGQTAWDFVN